MKNCRVRWILLLAVALPGPGVRPEDPGVRLFRMSAEKEHTLRITRSRLEYAIDLGGTVDMENTLTRHHETFRVAFQITAGEPCRYEIRTLRSLGDLQHRYAGESQRFWEREEYAFKLVRGPAWLKLDAATGVLAGTPGAADVGTARVEIVARRRYPHEVDTADRRNEHFQKSAPRFQATHRQSFEIRVRSP